MLKCYSIDCTKDNGDEVIQFDNSIGQGVYTSEDTNVEKDTASSSDKSYQQPNQVPIQPTPIKLSTLIKKYNIDSYPTVKLTKGDVVVDFDSKITKDTLIQFVNSV